MSDFIVVGAGLAGLLTARELRLAGARVTILEQGDVGRQASWAGGGILSPLYPWNYPAAVNTLVAASQRQWPDLCASLHAASGIDPEYRASGMLVLDDDMVERGVAWGAESGNEIATVHSAAGRGQFAPIEFPEPRALWMPRVAQVRNPRLLAALRAHVESLGVRIIERAMVSELLRTGERVRGVAAADRTWFADAVVVTAGAWTGEVLRSAGLLIPLRPVRGQMLLLRAAPNELRQIVLYQGRYLVPRGDGRILVGSTMEEVGFDCDVTDEARGQLLQFARMIVPQLASAAIEKHWAGLRPGSPHGVPLVGPVPGLSGLYVNAGHFRNGVVMGPASAQLAADQMLGRAPAVDAAPYQFSAWAG